MVIRTKHLDSHLSCFGRVGALSTELMIALGILVGVMFPVAYSMIHEQKLARAYYHRAIAMEIVDGELEILRAGEWRAYSPGTRVYTVRANAAKNLPAGEFRLELNGNRIRLEWIPRQKDQGGRVVREIKLEQ